MIRIILWLLLDLILYVTLVAATIPAIVAPQIPSEERQFRHVSWKPFGEGSWDFGWMEHFDKCRFQGGIHLPTSCWQYDLFVAVDYRGGVALCWTPGTLGYRLPAWLNQYRIWILIEPKEKSK